VENTLPPTVKSIDRTSKAMTEGHMFHPILCLMKIAPANKSAYNKHKQLIDCKYKTFE